MVRAFLKTILFLAPIFIPIVLISGIFGYIGLIIGLAISFILCFFILFYQDRIVLRVYRGYPILPGCPTSIKEKLEILCNRFGVSIPSVYITELPLPSSFIVGKSLNKTSLVIPIRLLNLLDEDELEAMFAYNIVQINNHIRLKTLAALMAYLMTAPASVIRWGALFTGFGDLRDPAPRLLGLFFMGLAAPPAATIIHSVADKDHDYDAAILCENPKTFESAINKLEENNVSAYPSLGFICLIDTKKENLFEYLFDTHLSKEIRKKNLNEMELRL